MAFQQLGLGQAAAILQPTEKAWCALARPRHRLPLRWLLSRDGLQRVDPVLPLRQTLPETASPVGAGRALQEGRVRLGVIAAVARSPACTEEAMLVLPVVSCVPGSAAVACWASASLVRSTSASRSGAPFSSAAVTAFSLKG